ncbi:glutathione S-transferase N-terminal domain-containing protein [Modicisalibacter radicis]|uniref:glutathione S-transferase N-terminal domain-containing protein n=1 Tax=Halomonas sp. EAR18 TaxID=2518972 RepID=UPI00109CD1FF|nr:glutathione S-transferase N-terminal domain-containing protein [Halomonas sp. EAR18]
MELYLNATSPYARVARIVLLEKGLADTVTLRWCDPWADDDGLLAVNPVGRIPALVTDDGTTLSESLLIAHYLDTLGGGEPVLPAARLGQTLHLAGLGQGLTDAAFTTIIARKHQGAEADASVLGQRRWRAIQRTLDRLEREVDARPIPAAVTLGEITVAVALDYLTFRLPEVDWPKERPQLTAWHARITEGESFRQTRFA